MKKAPVETRAGTLLVVKPILLTAYEMANILLFFKIAYKPAALLKF